uniref:PGG domain-containing protein n=1 Tax=Leersia perrieri TaxID=77586 RepID=A0A0D9WPJ8_9ORYZ
MSMSSSREDKKNVTTVEQSWEYQLREYIMLLASVVAIATYSAGLSPPGGVWQNDDTAAGGHKAGDPILHDDNGDGAARYHAFYYCNATAFAASLVVNLLLLVLKEESKVGLTMLRTVMVLDVLALMGAYAAGSCRDLPTTVYVSTLVVALSAYLCIHIVLHNIRPENNNKNNVRDEPNTADEAQKPEEKTNHHEMRRVLMLLATFATEITYTAGLNPPGGFRAADGSGGSHVAAGEPTLQQKNSARLMAFFYCNTAAFVASLSIVVPLLSSRLHKTRIYLQLYGPILIALFGLMGAYAAGSSREPRTVAYLVAAVLAYILLAMVIALLSRESNANGNETSTTSEGASTEGSKTNESSTTSEGASTEGSKTNEVLKAKDFVLLLATLAATITYQAGLSPPGGVWPEDDKLYGHKAGDPILLSTHAERYKAFFYCNSTAFAASLVVIFMVQSNRLVESRALVVAMILDLFGLIGAYAAGSCRDVSTSIYVMALAGAVLVYVVIHIVFSLDKNEGDNENLEKAREQLLVLAILVATIAYQAGLTPPGGFWEKDGDDGRRAGAPVLFDSYPSRYQAFFYCNATGFMASVALIVLLVNPKLYRLGIRCYALYVCMVVGMFGLMGAYAAGSARHVRTSIYVFVLVGVVVVFLLVQLVYFHIWKKSTSDQGSNTNVPGPDQTARNTKQDSKRGDQQTAGTNTEQDSKRGDEQRAGTNTEQGSKSKDQRSKYTEENSKREEYIMTLAILAASVTYQAGLQPPGSVWQEGDTAGNPVMHDRNEHRYHAFYYCNSTSFVASVVVIMLLLQQYRHQTKMGYNLLVYAMNTVIVVDLLGLLGAYAAGSCRDWETSGYVIGLAAVVLAFIAVHFLWNGMEWYWRRGKLSKGANGVSDHTLNSNEP